MPIRLVVGEDNYLALTAISKVFEFEEDIEIVATRSDLGSLRDAVDEERPDVLLTDIQMPPTLTNEGIRLASELRTTHPGLGVVILSQYANPLYAAELLEAGSDGRAYLLKERVQHGADVTRAVREVAEGRSVIDSRIVDLLLTSKQARHSSRLGRLTDREKDVLGLVAEGWTNAAISERLGISTRAVERHVRAIFTKLDLGDSTHHRRVRAALLYLSEPVG